ncbi:MAG: glycosyltransferase family 4 protein [Chthoniobacteraceae bacterium]
MKILTLCYEYPPLGGGAGRVAKSIAEGLAARGHEVRFQTGGMPHLPKCERIGGVDVHRTNSFRKREEACSVFEMGLFVLTSFLPTLRHLRTWRPDVMHVHLAVPTGALAFAVHRVSGVPYVITAHLGDVPGALPEQTDHLFRRLGPFIRPIWEKAARISAVSEFVRQLAERAYGREVTTIFNAVDLQNVPTDPVRVGQPLQFISVGRFNPQKNFVFLVKTLATVADLDWRLTIVGDGADMDAVRDAVARHGLEKRVSLPGWCAAGKVGTLLEDADIFLMPSTVEGLSVAAIEALKHGLALIGSDICGLQDVIDDGVNGLRFPVGDSARFAASLRALLGDSPVVLRMKTASRAKVRQFDLEKIAAQYEELLRAGSGKA